MGPWITEAKPEFGPGTKERFEAASKTEPALVSCRSRSAFCPRKGDAALFAGHGLCGQAVSHINVIKEDGS